MAEQQAARYVLEQPIARGGMGELFLATRVLPGAADLRVVVKRVATRGAPEAELLSRLRHPNIVQVLDHGPGQRGEYFLILELIQGLTLARLRQAHELSGERLALELVLTIALEVLRGLSHAHDSSARAGQLVVHRDVSPENILLSETGAVKLADFGVALVRRADELEDDEVVVGKPRYMAPEQLIGGPIDARTDLFSVGVVLFEAMTGESPFAGGSEAERQAAAYAGEIRPLPGLRRDVPFELWAIVRQACASRAENRFSSARQMLEALERLARTELSAAPPERLARAVQSASARLRTKSDPPRSGMRALGELRRARGAGSAFLLSLERAAAPARFESLLTLRGR